MISPSAVMSLHLAMPKRKKRKTAEAHASLTDFKAGTVIEYVCLQVYARVTIATRTMLQLLNLPMLCLACVQLLVCKQVP